MIYTVIAFAFTILIAVAFGWDTSLPIYVHGDVFRIRHGVAKGVIFF
jgi:hypothetical protein